MYTCVSFRFMFVPMYSKFSLKFHCFSLLSHQHADKGMDFKNVSNSSTDSSPLTGDCSVEYKTHDFSDVAHLVHYTNDSLCMFFPDGTQCLDESISAQ